MPVYKLFVEAGYNSGHCAVTFGNMDAPRPPQHRPKAQAPSDLELGAQAPVSIASEEDLGYDLTEDDDQAGTDPEHSRRLAAVRTELLRRSQHRTPSE